MADADDDAGVLRRVESFVLLERLGVGGLGVVYAAFDEPLERKVAIKLIAPDRATPERLRAAQAQARLSHPNVVTIYAAGTLPDGTLFIAMELIKGRRLRDWQATMTDHWQAIVGAYAAVGAGLAAAHRAGIWHGALGPDAILVGDDRRIWVADFGLAADAPAYRAPEPDGGARGDQYSFCAALCEAIGGERLATGAHPVLPPRTPRWLGRVLARGLARDPAARFPTMDDVVHELTRSRVRTRRRVAAWLAGAAAISATVTVFAGGAPPACPLEPSALDGAWDPAIKLRVQSALLGTGAPFAANVWASTQTAFDRYAERWTLARRAACEATHVAHKQSAALLDLRMECLAGRRRSLAAAAEALASRPTQAIGHAGEILERLGDIEPCADTSVLHALVAGRGPAAAWPLASHAQAEQAEVRQQLARADALLATGDLAGAEPIVADATRRAAGLDDDALRAELAYFAGRLALAHGELAPSLVQFHRAVELAVASHHDELSADIWLHLAIAAGSLAQRPTEIASWLGRGEAWIRRLGHAADSRQIEAERARAYLQLTAGDAAAAQATLSHALATAEALWGKDDPRLIPLLRNRAAAYRDLHDAKPTVADAERALALGIAAWGPDYPEIAATRVALGLAYLDQLGDVDRGEQQLRLAFAQYRAQLGDDSVEGAICEQGLSEVGLYRGDYATALGHAEHAAQVFTRKLGTDNPRRGEALMGVGALRYLRKDFAGSLAAYQEALPILGAALGPGHTNVGLLHGNIGETLLALGRDQDAERECAQALAILERSVGPNHSYLALPLKGLGLARLHRHEPREAIAPLERALALHVADAAADPQELAEIRWALARALEQAGREPARARGLAEAALAGYRGLGAQSSDRVDDITRWLVHAHIH